MNNSNTKTQFSSGRIARPWAIALSSTASMMIVATACGSTATTELVDTTTTVSQPTSATELVTSTTSTAPTTTTQIDQRDDVAAAFQAQFVAWRTCTADYDACDPAAAFVDVYTGRALVNLTASVLDKQGAGRKNTPAVPDLDEARVDSVDIGDDGVSATVAYCSLDSRIVTESDSSGDEVVIDDSVSHERGTAELDLGADGIWRLAEFDVVESSSEVPICDG